MLWTKQSSHRAAGSLWEDYAKQYLLKQGLQAVTQNFHSRQGEIDLIMKDGQSYVFVEVKYRKSNNFGGATAAVTGSKQQKLTQTAKVFLQQQGLNEYNTECRFDVIAIEGDENNPTTTWLKNAF